MKYISYFLSVLVMFVLLNSCSKDSDITDSNSNDVLFREILESFTTKTVYKTYEALSDNAILFYNSCVTMSVANTDQSVVDAAEAWIAAREHWEKSEAFLFGPANYKNLDPKIDSWPLDKNQLDQLLARPDINNIDPDYVRNNLGASLRGFHAVEYVLFRDGEARKASEISEAEKKYLVAVAAVLRDDCIDLEASWKGYDNISEEKQDYLDDAGIVIGSSFGQELMNAGMTGSRYASTQLALDEVIQGCMDIADEVGNSKIAEPAQSGNVLDVESWYSWNSLTDFKDNIRGIENVYLGGVPQNRGTGLTKFVAQVNIQLDTQIKAQISETITKIAEIGEPFRNNLNNTEKINAAINSCTNLMNSLSQIKNLF